MPTDTTSTAVYSPRPLPNGAWPVLLVPYDEQGGIDLKTLDDYVDWSIETGAAGLFPVALSGEMFELDQSERLLIAERVVQRSGGRVPVVASAIGEPEELADRVREVAATGVDAVILNAANVLEEGADETLLRPVIEAVLAANPDTALGIYECPRPYHRLLSTDAVSWLAGTRRFTFFKETTWSVDAMRERVTVSDGTPLKTYYAGVGSVRETAAFGVNGTSGWVVNIYPDWMGWLGQHHDHPEAATVEAALREIHTGIEASYPASAKYLIGRRSGIDFPLRSRWRPSDIDTGQLDRLLTLLPDELPSS